MKVLKRRSKNMKKKKGMKKEKRPFCCFCCKTNTVILWLHEIFKVDPCVPLAYLFEKKKSYSSCGQHWNKEDFLCNCKQVSFGGLMVIT